VIPDGLRATGRYSGPEVRFGDAGQVCHHLLWDTAGIATNSGWFMANAMASPNLRALPTLPSSAQILSSEAVLDALKMILLDAPLNEVLMSVTRLIETHSDGMLCSIFLLDQDGLRLRYGATNLPEAFRAATDGLCIGPNVGSCGTAAYLRQSVFVSDILSDPKWVKFKDSSGRRTARLLVEPDPVSRRQGAGNLLHVLPGSSTPGN